MLLGQVQRTVGAHRLPLTAGVSRADADLDGIVTINELLFAVNSALDGCR